MIRKNICPWLGLLYALFLTGGAAIACELPAEPAAAVVPLKTELANSDGSGDGKVRIIENPNGTFEFLVPDNTVIKMRIAWDPYDHNGGRLDEKYEWVNRSDKGNIPVDENLPEPQEHGYFPLEKMAEFFTVTGNRGSIIEAFNRANGGAIEGNRFMSDNSMGPMLLLSNAFVKPGQEGKISILDDQRAPDYPSTSSLCSPSGSDITIEEIDPILPNDGTPFSTKTLDPPLDFEKDGKKYRKNVRYLWGKSGVFMGELNIGITQLKNEDYKAYIVAGEPNVWMDGTLPVLEEGTKGGLGNTTGEINVKFPTPTLGATEPIRIKVNAPAAGFEITNLFWCWEEENRVMVASDTNDDGELDTYVDDSSDSNCGVSVNKCSVGLKATVTKPSSGNGFSAFRVYNTRAPIASKLEVGAPPSYLATPTFTCCESGISVPFRLTVYGSDPFANILPHARTDSFGNPVLMTHDVPGMLNSIKIFMSYPVYSFATATDIGVNDLDNLQKINLGLLEFMNSKTPTWKGKYYEQKWVWREANTCTITKSEFNTIKADGSDYLGGGYWTIEGNAEFNVPVPQHFSNDGQGKSLRYSARDIEYPAPGMPDGSDYFDKLGRLWKIFAIAQDTSGFKSASYDAVAAAVQPSRDYESAGQVLENGVVLPDNSVNVLKKVYNQSPPLATRIPTDIPVSDNNYTWQKYAYLMCKDENTPPEIELIVFDTRNNRYHIFGTKAGGDSKNEIATFSGYYEADPVIYSEEDNTEIDNALKFETFEEDLYARFIDKNQEGGASTLSEPALAGRAFVCQANTRLVFYIRAWDNMNTFMEANHFGVKEIAYTVKDENKASADNPPDTPFKSYDPQDLMQNPPVWQFRAPNVTGGTPDGKECSITIQAKDYSDAVRTLVLKIFVVGSDLTIRSLEEKRQRN